MSQAKVKGNKPGLLMRPEKDEAKAEARKCEVKTEAKAKTYEAEATVSNESCNI